MNLPDFVALLKGVKKNSGGFMARCPAHDDRQASLSVSNGDDKILVHCHAGCDARDIVSAIGLTLSDLFTSQNGAPPGGACPPKGLTLEALADAKRLPVEVLKGYGLKDETDRYGNPVVLIPYYSADGDVVYEKTRTALEAKRGSFLPKGVKPMAYGLDRLAGVADCRHLIVVEGESDSWTLWLHGYQAIGIPGATNTKTLRDVNLSSFEVLHVIEEPDKAGATFCLGVQEELEKAKFQGRAFRVRLDGAKDPSELHIQDPERFDERFRAALEAARPLDEGGDSNEDGVVVVRVADVSPKEIQWLWEGRFPLGKLTLVAGEPGLGKSFLTLDMAARVSKGRAWPDSPPDERTKPGGVVLLNAEDDIADTIRPRLDALDADVSRIDVVTAVRINGKQRQLNLAEDLAALEKAIKKNPRGDAGMCRLVVIDPVSAYLGSTVSDRNNAELRAVLAPLAAIAGKHGVAVIAVHHLNKGAGKADVRAIDRVMGSLAFTAAPRAVWVVTSDLNADVGGRVLLLPLKMNIGPKPNGMAFSVRVPAGGLQPVVSWENGPVDTSADDALHKPEAASPRDVAKAWLQGILARGAVPVAEIESIAEGHGLAWRTIKRAKKDLAVESSKSQEQAGPWEWSLPT